MRFHLGHTLRKITDRRVELDDGTLLEADLIVVGIGVKPDTAVAEAAGISTDRGVLVDEFLETSVPGIFGPVILHAGLIHRQVKRFESSTGWSRSGKVKRRHETFLAAANVLMPSPFSGVITTMSEFGTSAILARAIKSRSPAI